MLPSQLTQARTLLADHGKLRPQSTSDWQGPFDLPPALADFYYHVGPVDITIKTYGNPYHLPSLAKLWNFQAGYRWNGLTHEPITNWNDDWLVIADQGGDPFIFDRASSKILFAYHGEGTWDASELFDNIALMASTLATLGSIFRTAGRDITDKNHYIKPIYRQRALEALTQLLGSDNDAIAILEIAGWG